MKSRTIAIAGSIAALAFAGAPVSAIAATQAHHRPATESRVDRSRDATGVRHIDKSADNSKDHADSSPDVSDR
jgi:hypothetical protein